MTRTERTVKISLLIATLILATVCFFFSNETENSNNQNFPEKCQPLTIHYIIAICQIIIICFQTLALFIFLCDPSELNEKFFAIFFSQTPMTNI